MRQAFELAWANAYVYARQRPYIEFMDDILFQAPVEIGSLLYFNSQVIIESIALSFRLSIYLSVSLSVSLSLSILYPDHFIY